MQTTTFAKTTKWSDDLSLLLIYALVLGGIGYFATLSSIPDRAIAPQSTSISAGR